MINLNKLFLIILLSTLCSYTIAQKQDFTTINKKAIKYYQLAKKHYNKGNTKEAIINLNKALTKDSLFIEAFLLKGDILMTMGKNREAIETLNKSIKIDSNFFPPVWAMLGELYYKTGDYYKSASAYKKFINCKEIPEKRKIKVKKLLKVSEKAAKLWKENNRIKITALNKHINTPEDEYVNFVYSDKTSLIFTRKTKYYSTKYKQTIVKESFYKCSLNDTSATNVKKWETPWMKNKNVGSLSFSADGREMYFTGCGWKSGLGSCDLYYSKKENNKWIKPINLGKNINTKGWESQPVVSPDDKYLFFASQRKGGKGGSDIWMSVKINGKWSKPVNMGDSINTEGNEMAPFIYADSRTLIFSSDGWPSLGGKDLFISRKNEAGIWSKAENIGAPTNTRYNEINFVYSLDGKTAWISSDRNNKKYDIFQLPVYKKIQPSYIIFVNGKTIDNDDGKPVKAFISLTNISNGITIDSTFSNDTGDFLIIINNPGDYAFNIFAKGYLPYSKNIIFNNRPDKRWKYNKIFKLKKIKKGESFILRNIYFDIDKFNLNPKSFSELDRLISILKLNKELNLEIIGHTDNTGNKNYNLELSKKRAYSVYKYLVKKGINENRLKYKGMGDTNPIVPNSNEQNKAINRRVEFIVY